MIPRLLFADKQLIQEPRYQHFSSIASVMGWLGIKTLHSLFERTAWQYFGLGTSI